MSSLRFPPFLVTPALVAVSLLDVWFQVDFSDRIEITCGLTAALALMFRRWVPGLVFLATLPAAAVTWALYASLIALFTLATRTRRPWILGSCAIAFALCTVVPWPNPRLAEFFDASSLVLILYNLATAFAPILLGTLVVARRDLAQQLTEIEDARAHEQLLTTQSVLAKERAQLAREMHDVVSHQVSLIAVRAGALQVSTRDPEVKDAASTIRMLSVRTLNELRHMVGVLRAPGSASTELTPQPTLGELPDLVAGSAVDAGLSMDLPPDLELSPPIQRALYRMVQEGLTNVREHAPGSTATVGIWIEDGSVRARVTNTAPTGSVLALPGAGHGLVGLRQRADLLHGSIEAVPTDEAGFRLEMRLPL